MAGGDETILVVEDEPAVAAVSFQVLSRSGYRVLLADSGESAIGLLKGHSGRIALLLVDVILPDMRGPQVVDGARKIHPESAVLYASGYSADSVGRRGELADGVDLIEKPFAPDDLLARVRIAIDRAATRSVEAAGLPRPRPRTTLRTARLPDLRDNADRPARPEASARGCRTVHAAG